MDDQRKLKIKVNQEKKKEKKPLKESAMTVESGFEEFLKPKVRFYQSVSSGCHPGGTASCDTRVTTELDLN